MEKYIYYNGLKFTRDDKTGYYLNSTIRKRLHRYVYENEAGEIPKGYHIHHKDHDKSNNDISNLELLHHSEHLSLHGKHRFENNKEEVIKNLEENARPKAIEWHKSDSGKTWHKEHYENMKEKLHEKVKTNCLECSNEFDGLKNRSKFCSNKCKSKYRRKSGVDDIEKKCEFCGKSFKINKYSKTRFCSRSCTNRGRKLNKDKVD